MPPNNIYKFFFSLRVINIRETRTLMKTDKGGDFYFFYYSNKYCQKKLQ